MEKIAILTSGGDAPGMNACIRAVVRYAIYNDMEVYGVEKGYNGLINDEMRRLERRSVSDILQRGGTILKTARCEEFNTLEGQEKAAKALKKRGIEGLVVIGGDGSFRGAKDLHENFGVKVVGIPGTIDNDLYYTDYTLGFDTAVNTVLSAINNIRDTMTSHDRVAIIEVMGRNCGDIALYAGIGGGAEYILVPEIKTDYDALCQKLKESYDSGKTSDIILLAEGAAKGPYVEKIIRERVGISVRTTVLGYIQRGGGPSNSDRVLAARFGVHAVKLLKDNISGRVVGVVDNKIIDTDICTALSMKGDIDKNLYDIAAILSI